MNIQDYISSGILENYVLGLVTETERQEVERMVVKHPEIRAELNAIEEALTTYAQENGVPMPSGLTEQILNKIDRMQALSSGINELQKTQKTDRRTRNILVVLGLLLLLLIAFGIYLYIQNDRTQTRLLQSQTNFEVLQKDCDEIRQRVQKLEQHLNIIRDEYNSSILMRGTDKAPRAYAAVYYNAQDTKAYLDIRNLPNPPSDQQYQLWAIVDGTPTDMGVFEVVIDPENLTQVPFVQNAQAFAVTLEQRGGSPTPTLEEMYVIGNKRADG